MTPPPTTRSDAAQRSAAQEQLDALEIETDDVLQVDCLSCGDVFDYHAEPHIVTRVAQAPELVPPDLCPACAAEETAA